jgi:hypothetical protein
MGFRGWVMSKGELRYSKIKLERKGYIAMSIEVNGHQLPSLLVKLIEEGKWGDRQILSADVVNKLLGKLGLLPIELDMAKDDIQAKDWSKFGGSAEKRPRMFEIYGLASSKESGYQIENELLLDIDKAIFIAGNNDEEVICLDYRENPAEPRIMIGLWNKTNANWHTIAPDFETFARELGLME